MLLYLLIYFKVLIILLTKSFKSAMNWYYVENGKAVGPFDDAKFFEIFKSGKISTQTLVWNDTLKDWTLLGAVQDQIPLIAKNYSAEQETVTQPNTRFHSCKTSLTNTTVCSNCGMVINSSIAIKNNDFAFCPECFNSRTIEHSSMSATTSITPSKFFPRALAKLIDIVILSISLAAILNFYINFVSKSPAEQNVIAEFVKRPVMNLIVLIFMVFYNLIFLSIMGTTPGKLVMKLKVVTSTGEKPSFWTALIRSSSEILSMIIFYLGYLMSIIDSERRTLHDFIANTRVIQRE